MSREGNKSIAIGVDIGTMNIIVTNSADKKSKIMRNVFLKLDQDEVSIDQMSDIAYVKNEDGELFIIGEDAFTLSNIFGKEISRPMKHGLISPDEIDAIDVLTMMLSSLIGEVKSKDTYCSYSIPAEAIDEKRSVIYHEKVFGKILSSLGINHTSVNEGMAVIYSECAKEKFSGISCSFGAGMQNCAISFRGVEALTFSTARSGDWIDNQVAISLNMVQNRVTNIKEKNLNLEDSFIKNKNKKIRRVLEALEYYYISLIEYTVKKIIKKFESDVDVEIDDAIPIVIAGGTSMVPGFVKIFTDTIRKYELPFEVSEIRAAENPLISVSNGLLVKTLSDIKN